MIAVIGGIASIVPIFGGKRRRRSALVLPVWLLLPGCIGCAPAAVATPSPAVVTAPPEPVAALPSSEPPVPLAEPVDQAPIAEAPGILAAFPRRFGALGRCAISGTPERIPVRVDPTKGSPFLVQVANVTADVTFGSGEGSAARVVSSGPVRFEGSAHALALTLKKSVSRHEGMVFAPRGARLLSEHELSDGQVRVNTSTGVPIDVPCDHLGLGAREPSEDAKPQREPTLVAVDSAPLLLAPSARAVPSLALPTGLEFTRIAGGVDFVKISHRSWDGVILSGYVPAPRVTDARAPRFGARHGACACFGRGYVRQPRAASEPYEGLAKLRAGALIYAERDGGAWARADGDVAVVVNWAGGDEPWVRVDQLPGVRDVSNNPCNCDRVTHAYVRRGGVEF